jgi:hypothetical protein
VLGIKEQLLHSIVSDVHDDRQGGRVSMHERTDELVLYPNNDSILAFAGQSSEFQVPGRNVPSFITAHFDIRLDRRVFRFGGTL